MIPVDRGAGSPPSRARRSPGRSSCSPPVLAPGVDLHLAHLRPGLGTSLSLSTKGPDLPVAAVKPPPGTLPVRRRFAVGGF